MCIRDSDKKDREALGDIAGELETKGCRLHLGEGYLEGLSQDLIFRTPGMRPDLPGPVSYTHLPS